MTQRDCFSGAVGRPIQAADPLSSGSSRLKAGCGQDCPPHKRNGQATMEFAIIYAAIILPLTFMVIFVAEMLWVWHSVTDFTREGARYAATHCWQSDTGNVLNYMTTHVPRMIDMDQFQNGAAGITVQYFARDPDSGTLTDFTCDAGDCTTNCVPDAVTVSVTSYQFTRFAGFFRLPAVALPDLHASAAMGGAGCDEAGTCLP